MVVAVYLYHSLTDEVFDESVWSKAESDNTSV